MKALSIVSMALVLAGCGGSESGDGGGISQAPLDSRYYGMWGISNLATVMISRGAVTSYIYDADNGCFEVGYFKITQSTANSVTTEDVYTGEVDTTKFAMNGSLLRLSDGSDTLELEKTEWLNPVPGCDNVDGIASIKATMELAYLPEVVTINRTAQQSGYVEYGYELNFDMNKNNVVDAGDIALRLMHYKRAGEEQDQTVLLRDLDAQLWYYSPKQGEDKFLSGTNSDTGYKVQVQQSGNQLSFQMNTNQHAGLMYINEDTPVSVKTTLHYPAPETNVIEGMADGPWNWSSIWHEDMLPESGFIVPSNQPGLEVLDAVNDQTRGESKWVDIISVRFNFN